MQGIGISRTEFGIRGLEMKVAGKTDVGGLGRKTLKTLGLFQCLKEPLQIIRE